MWTPLASKVDTRVRATGAVEPLSRSARGAPTLLGILLSRTLSKSFLLAERVGLVSLLIGLTLVGLTELRLPGGVGGWADPFLAMSLLCAFWLAWQRRIRVQLFAIHAVGLLMLLTGAAITALHVDDAAPTILALVKFLFATTFMFFTCAMLIDRREQLIIAAGCWILSAVVTSGGAAFLGWFGEAGRLAGLSGNPNHLGVIAAIALAPALSLASNSERLARAAWIAAAIVCTAGIAVSASRTGAVAALGSMTLWGLLHYRLNREFTVAVIGCCLAAAAAAGFLHQGGPGLTERLSVAITDPESDVAIRSRLGQYDFVLRNASKRLFAGGGLSPDETTAYGEGVHNTFLLALRGGGILAFLGMIVIAGDLLRKGLQSYSVAQSHQSKVMAVGLFAAVVGTVLAGMTEPIFYQRVVWVPAALLFAYSVVGRSRHQDRNRHRRSTGGRRRGASVSGDPNDGGDRAPRVTIQRERRRRGSSAHGTDRTRHRSATRPSAEAKT